MNKKINRRSIVKGSGMLLTYGLLNSGSAVPQLLAHEKGDTVPPSNVSLSQESGENDQVEPLARRSKSNCPC